MSDPVQKLQELVVELMQHIDKLYERIGEQNSELPEALSVEQAADYLGRRPYTVRQWCRNGRIKACRAQSGKGPYKEWRISKESIEYYQANGLLPLYTNDLHDRHF